jgi:hypothetical protein
MSSAELSAVQARIRKAMFYPEAVQFGAFNSGRCVDGKVVVCGWIYAKNVGGEPFYGVLTSVGGTPVFDYQLFTSEPLSIGQANQMCRGAGVALPVQ